MFEQPHYQKLYQEREHAITERVKALAAVGAPEEEIWLTERMRGITGTRMGVLMGVSRYKTQHQVWEEMMGLNLRPQKENAAMHWGKRLEATVADEYEDITGTIVEECPSIRSPNMPFLIGSPDRIVCDANYNPIRILECKTTRLNTKVDEWDDDGNQMLLWGKGNIYNEYHVKLASDSQIPADYYMQVLTYMMLTGLREADLAVLISTSDFRVFSLTYDEKLAADALAVADEWYCRHILDGIEPPRVEADLKKTTSNGQTIDATPDIIAAVNDLRKVKAGIKELEQQEQKLKDQIISFIGDNDGITSNGKSLITYKTQKGRDYVDGKLLELEHPDIYKQYYKQGAAFRVLRMGRA